MRREELMDAGLHRGCFKRSTAVPGTWQDQQGCLHPSGAQRRAQGFTLPKRHQRILITVEDKKRGVVP